MRQTFRNPPSAQWAPEGATTREGENNKCSYTVRTITLLSISFATKWGHGKQDE